MNVVAGYALYSFRSELQIGGGKRFAVLLLLLLVFCVSDFYYKSDQWNMIRAICLVTIVFISLRSRKLLGFKPLIWLGGISMNIYLLHMMVLYMITCRMADTFFLSLMDVSVMFAVTLMVTIGLAYVYTKFVEKRLNKVVDRLLDRLV